MRSTAAAFLMLLSTEALAEPSGRGDDGLPGLARVDTGAELRPGFAVSFQGGYGFTGATVEEKDRHHRSVGRMTATFALLKSFAFGVRLDGRYDRHTRLAEGSDDGWVGDPRLIARFRHSLNPDLAIAAQAGLWLPGATAPSVVPSAATPEAALSMSYRLPDSSWTLATTAGYRHDRSAESVDAPELLSPSDRMSLGASDSKAVLLGAGALYSIGMLESFAELTADVLVGKNAPSTSPARLTGGVRLMLTPSLQAQLTADLRLTDIEQAANPSELRPFEPTVQMLAGISWHFGKEEKIVLPPEPLPEPLPPEPVVLPTVELLGRILFEGEPVAGATVTLQRENEGEQSTETDAQGRFSFPEQGAGAVTVSVRGEGFNVAKRSVSIDPKAGTTDLEFALEKTLPPGQLRGTIRSFSGQGIAATLTVGRVEVSFAETFTSEPDGTFEVDLPPGSYEVTIDAPGLTRQVRSVKIEENGVTILNVGLRK